MSNNNNNIEKLNVNGVVYDLKPIEQSSAGEGLPYAPINWPNHGDIWRWRTGKRVSGDGCFHDRYLFAPKTLPKGGVRDTLAFYSLSMLQSYIQQHFPNDFHRFFASFSWKIPAVQNTNHVFSQEESKSSGKKRKRAIRSAVKNKGKQKVTTVPSLVIREQKVTTISSDLEENDATGLSARLNKEKYSQFTEKTDKFYEPLKDKGVMVGNRECEMNKQVVWLQTNIDENLGFLQDANKQIALLQKQRDKFDNLIESMRKEKKGLLATLEDGICQTTQEITSSTQIPEKTDKLYEPLKANKAKVGNRECELKEELMLLQTKIDDILLIVQGMNDQIAVLQNRCNELVNIILSMKRKKNVLIAVRNSTHCKTRSENSFASDTQTPE
ncbi:hypothetical protein ACFE04_002132 [Oxalis oulophora]